MDEMDASTATYIPMAFQLVSYFKNNFIDCPSPELCGETVDIAAPLGAAVPFYALTNLLLSRQTIKASECIPFICWCVMSTDRRLSGVPLFGTGGVWDVERLVENVFGPINRGCTRDTLIQCLRYTGEGDDNVSMHLDPSDMVVVETVRGGIWCKSSDILALECNYLTILGPRCQGSHKTIELMISCLQSPYDDTAQGKSGSLSRMFASGLRV